MVEKRGINGARWSSATRMDIDHHRRFVDWEDNSEHDDLKIRQKKDMVENIPINVGDGKKMQRTRFALAHKGIVEREVVQINERSTVAIQHVDWTQ